MVVGNKSIVDSNRTRYPHFHHPHVIQILDTMSENIVTEIKNIMVARGHSEESLEFFMRGENLVMRVGFWKEISNEDARAIREGTGLVAWEDAYDDGECLPRYSYELRLG
jgi:hypothetical protein